MDRLLVLACVVICLVVLGAGQAAGDGSGVQPAPPYPPEVAPSALLDQYRESQSDPALDAEARIRAAVDMYFRLLWVSIIEQRAYDCAFLVDRSSPSGQDLYNYEIGRLEFCLAWWEEDRVKYVDYRYSPAYEQLQVQGPTASVAVTVEIALWEPSGSSFAFSIEHEFTLASTSEGWKVVSDAYEDPFKKAYPLGTDFKARMPIPGSNEEIPPDVAPETPPSATHSWLPIAAWTAAGAVAVSLGLLLLVRERKVRKRGREQ